MIFLCHCLVLSNKSSLKSTRNGKYIDNLFVRQIIHAQNPFNCGYVPISGGYRRTMQQHELLKFILDIFAELATLHAAAAATAERAWSLYLNPRGLNRGRNLHFLITFWTGKRINLIFGHNEPDTDRLLSVAGIIESY